MTQNGVADDPGYLKQRWAAVAGLALCLALLAGWCPGDECAKGMLLSIPWAGWGAAFYALCLAVPRAWLMPLAGAGILVHAHLVRVMLNEHAACGACLLAVALTACLFVAGAREHPAWRVGGAGLLILCAVVGIFLSSLPQAATSSPEAPVGSVPYQTASAETVRLVEQPAGQPTKQPVGQPAEQPVEQPVEQSVQRPAEQSTTTPAATVASIEATAPDGTPVRLNPAEKPILLFASWCEHCLEPLKAVAQLPSERRPYLVAVFWEGEAQETEAKLRQAGLDGADYYTSKAQPDSVPRLLTATGEVKGEGGVCAYLGRLRAF